MSKSLYSGMKNNQKIMPEDFSLEASNNDDQFIYHYSKGGGDEFNILKSMRISKVIDIKEIKEFDDYAKQKGDIGSYADSLSFLLDPAPLDVIAGVFKKQHPFWYSGAELFQYKVRINDLVAMPFEMVETPSKTALIDSITDEQWQESWYPEWRKIINDLLVMMGDKGDKLKALKASIKRYQGTTRERYLMVTERADYEGLKTKYAATVPHLMVYPKNGLIKIDSVTRVRVK